MLVIAGQGFLDRVLARYFDEVIDPRVGLDYDVGRRWETAKELGSDFSVELGNTAEEGPTRSEGAISVQINTEGYAIVDD